MRQLTYDGLPVVRPKRKIVKQQPWCSDCRSALIWVRDRNELESRCINPRCASHARRAAWKKECEENDKALRWFAIRAPFFLLLLVGCGVVLVIGWVVNFLIQLARLIKDLTQALIEHYTSDREEWKEWED